MTKNGAVRLPPSIVDINVDLSRANFGYDGVTPVVGDAGVAIKNLLQMTKKRGGGLIAALPALKQQVWGRLRSDPRTRDAAAFVASVQRSAAGSAVVVNDMTIPGYWLGNYFSPDRSRAVQYPVGWGTLGYALPASVGAAFAGDLPVLAVCGDGGVMFALGELATIAQEQLAVTVLVVDDGGYGMLRFGRQEGGGQEGGGQEWGGQDGGGQDGGGQERGGQERGGQPGGEVPGTHLATPDFVKLAAAFGVEGVRVREVGAPLEEALRQALGARRPRLVVCDASLFPPKTTSPRWAEGA
jgi:thiamine pyrophosphate-dependent acetolactate synthase large subunit-like protein